VQKGTAVLKQRTGTAKLFAEAVTVSVIERPPRCQCRNTGANKACVS
jgi:hypothetical protein